MSVTSSDPIEVRTSRALRTRHRIALLAILLLLAAEVFLSNRQESQTWDESAHLYAGYEYWTHADFGRNPEHPPLAKLVAASAVLPLHPVDPAGPSTTLSKVQDYFNGREFLYGADADLLLARARAAMLIFPLALALAIFAAGYEMFGPEAGLLAMLLFALEPMVLANSGLVTTDIALSCTLFLTSFAFYRYLKRPSLVRMLLCGLVAGLTLAAKHSGVFLFPILGIFAAFDLLLKDHRSPRIPVTRRLATLVVALVIIALVSYAVLWAFYGFCYAARPSGLPFVPAFDAYVTAIPIAFERSAIAFCARHHLLPQAYLYGWADILQIPGKRISFVFGKLVVGSRWYLFPELILIKSTLPLLLLLLLVPFSGIHRRRREFLILAIPAAFYLLIAIASGMNSEARYILPIYSFAVALAGAAAWQITLRSRRWASAIVALFVFAAGTSLHAFPDYLAYANEAFGGPSNSYRLLAGSNNDWAQSLKWVKSYTDQHHLSDCWFDFTDPEIDWKYYGIPCKPLLSAWVPRGYPFLGPVPPVISGTVLISATELDGRQWGPGKLNPYAQFRDLHPDAQPGHVVLVYNGTFSVPLVAAYSLSTEAAKLADAGKMSEAIAKSEEAVQLAPDSANIQADLGITLIKAGRTEEGQRINATALHLAQGFHPEFQAQLIRLLNRPGMTAPTKR
ncbi:MAG: phospholipid carrier-dependent glycosyltransferase [Acidobacteriota bacterium]|nr:phospholipid carrier-dependent glycosyltransferase [Acidobacteriota bacterium]